MELRVAIICIAFTQISAQDGRYYKTDIYPKSSYIDDQDGEKAETRGFVEPLDFSAFSQQFLHGGEQNFASLPFTASGGFDFFGAESKENHRLAPASAGFRSAFDEEKQNSTGFVSPVNFASPFGNEGSSHPIYRPTPVRSTVPPTPESDIEEAGYSPTTIRARSSKEDPKGKSSYPSPRRNYKPPPPTAVYADSADVEVFYPPEKAILPQINGRPKPYDGYRAASDDYYQSGSNRNVRGYDYDDAESRLSPKKVRYDDERSRSNSRYERKAPPPQEEEEEEEEEEPQPKKKSSGYKYQYDSSINVPDLVIKKYPYETPTDNDEEFTHSYEHYKSSLPDDLEKHYGTPDFVEKYTVAATENLQKDQNCEKIDKRGKRDVSQTCYICRNPKTGGSYEQCAYEDQPDAKKYYYGGSTSSASETKPKPVKYRYRRSLDFHEPTGYEYFVFDDAPDLKRKARAEKFFQTPSQPPKKRKNKKYSAKKKKPKRKARQHEYDPSAGIEGPPASYEGPRYTYEGPKHPYEGPSSPYEGPSSSYEGPDHDDYYDTKDDRIAYESNPPLLSSFYDGSKEKKVRPRRGPKADAEEFTSGYKSDYRFGPDFFYGEAEEKAEPAKRNTQPEASVDEIITGNVKIFKNGDICEKVKKESMTCMVCNNEKTGAKYEQCEYSTKPKPKAYSYGRQKSFSSNHGDRPQREAKDQSPEKSEKKITITKLEQKKTFNDGTEPLFSGESRVFSVRKQRQIDEESQSEDTEEAEEEPEKETETSERIEARDGIEGLDEYLEDEKEDVKEPYPHESESYEEYFKRVFPEFEQYKAATKSDFDPFEELENFDESKREENIKYEGSESVEKPKRLLEEKSAMPKEFYVNDEDSKKDLAEAFTTFQQRDWKNCEKMIKDKLVCYKCLNKDGIKNEECMYVEGSDPVSSHAAYHERKDYDPATLASQTNATEAVAESKLKGEFEGVERPRRTEEEVKKKKYPVKKFKPEVKNGGKSGDALASGQSDVRIYFNNTESAGAA